MHAKLTALVGEVASVWPCVRGVRRMLRCVCCAVRTCFLNLLRIVPFTCACL